MSNFILFNKIRSSIKLILLSLQKFLMLKNYFYIALTVLLFNSFGAKAQDNRVQARNQETSIEGLSFYPNPVSNGKIYITSKLSLDKEIYSV